MPIPERPLNIKCDEMHATHLKTRVHIKMGVIREMQMTIDADTVPDAYLSLTKKAWAQYCFRECQRVYEDDPLVFARMCYEYLVDNGIVKIYTEDEAAAEMSRRKAVE